LTVKKVDQAISFFEIPAGIEDGKSRILIKVGWVSLEDQQRSGNFVKDCGNLYLKL